MSIKITGFSKKTLLPSFTSRPPSSCINVFEMFIIRSIPPGYTYAFKFLSLTRSAGNSILDASCFGQKYCNHYGPEAMAKEAGIIDN